MALARSSYIQDSDDEDGIGGICKRMQVTFLRLNAILFSFDSGLFLLPTVQIFVILGGRMTAKSSPGRALHSFLPIRSGRIF